MKYLILLVLLAACIGVVLLAKRRAKEVTRSEAVRKRFALDTSEKGRLPLAPGRRPSPLPNPLLEQVGEAITLPRSRGETGESGKLVHTPDGEMILTRPPFALKTSVFSSRVGGYVNGLSRRLPAWVVACPRIRMDSLVIPTPPDGRDPTDWSTWRRRVRMRSIDILLCDRRDWKPLLAIMLERPAHLTRRGVTIGAQSQNAGSGTQVLGGPGGGVDRMIEEVLGHVGLPLIRASGVLDEDWPVIEPYVAEAILRSQSDEEVLRAADEVGQRPDPDAAVTLLRMDAQKGWLLE